MDAEINDINSYIAAFPEAIRSRLHALKDVVSTNAPGAEETIAYRMPTFRLNGNLVHFAAFEKHIGFYPNPTAISRFSEELNSYRTAKGSVQFPHHLPLPLDLVARIVQFRVQEQTAGVKE